MSNSSLPSLVEVARDLAAERAPDGYRIVVGFIDESWSVDSEHVRRSIEAEPASTGDPRLDALIAAAAEHIAFIDPFRYRDGSTAPGVSSRLRGSRSISPRFVYGGW